MEWHRPIPSSLSLSFEFVSGKHFLFPFFPVSLFSPPFFLFSLLIFGHRSRQGGSLPPAPFRYATVSVLYTRGVTHHTTCYAPAFKNSVERGLFLDIRRRKASSTFLLKKGCFFPLYRHLGVLFRKVGFDGF